MVRKRVFMFRDPNDPFVGEPADASAFYEAVGRFHMLWGQLESTIDRNLAEIRKLPEASAVFESLRGRNPSNFAVKAKLWRSAFVSLPQLKRFASVALLAMAATRDAAQCRRLITHGNWQEFITSHPLTLEIVMEPHFHPNRALERHTLTLDQVRECLHLLHKINILLIPLTFKTKLLSSTFEASRRAAAS